MIHCCGWDGIQRDSLASHGLGPGEELRKQVLEGSGTGLPEARPPTQSEVLAWGCRWQLLILLSRSQSALN